MSAMVANVSMDGINGEKVFFVRFYDSMKDVATGKPTDIWECSDVVVDSDVLEHLNDLRIVESMREK